MKPPEDFLAEAEILILEREGRITCLTNQIEILESQGYEALAAHSRQLLAMVQQNLAISQDNVRLMRKVRGLDSESHVFPRLAADRPHAGRSPPDASGRVSRSRFIVEQIIPEGAGVRRRDGRQSLPVGDDAKSAAD
jgi:hypothetical protein